MCYRWLDFLMDRIVMLPVHETEDLSKPWRILGRIILLFWFFPVMAILLIPLVVFVAGMMLFED